MRKTALLALAMICVSPSSFSQMAQQRTATHASNPVNPGGTTTKTGLSIMGGVPNPVTPLVGPAGIENSGVSRQGSPTFQNGVTAILPPTQIVPNSTSQMVPNSVAPNSTAQIAPNAAPEVPRPKLRPEGSSKLHKSGYPQRHRQVTWTCGWACEGSN
jgi:hypothetical protein